jgi:TrmH family RNA methyltransferase
MKGENIYKATLQKDGFILIGNEANGISDELKSLVTFPITIPSFGNTESLNAAVAAGIIVSEFKRRVDFSI